jgi:hypothetical protein
MPDTRKPEALPDQESWPLSLRQEGMPPGLYGNDQHGNGWGHAKLTQRTMEFYLAAASKNDFSTHQLRRVLGCQYNTARFLHHRAMEAMRESGLQSKLSVRMLFV